MTTLPLTPGLLISMSIRNDHSFGMMLREFGGIESADSLEEKQIELIKESFDEYRAHVAGENIQGQRREELTGEGFYNPDKEQMYCQSATSDAYQFAAGLCKAAGLIEGLE